jgi:hypothetical protein
MLTLILPHLNFNKRNLWVELVKEKGTDPTAAVQANLRCKCRNDFWVFRSWSNRKCNGVVFDKALRASSGGGLSIKCDLRLKTSRMVVYTFVTKVYWHNSRSQKREYNKMLIHVIIYKTFLLDSCKLQSVRSWYA